MGLLKDGYFLAKAGCSRALIRKCFTIYLLYIQFCYRCFVMLTEGIKPSLWYIPDMLVDSYILPECVVHPGSFGGLMVMYEANYIKLNQLVQHLSDCSGQKISHSANGCHLHLIIEERTKYTCHLRLTYLFDEDNDGDSGEGGEPVADPDLLAKVYFDARMVEVKGWINAHRHELLRELGRRYYRPLDQCWTRNIMLNKWLDYLLDQGHHFPAQEP